VIRFGDANAPVKVAVVADEVRDRRTGNGRGEYIGVRREEARVKSAPRVADDADFRGVDLAFRDDRFHARKNAFDDRESRLAWAKHDVGLEEEISAAREH